MLRPIMYITMCIQLQTNKRIHEMCETVHLVWVKYIRAAVIEDMKQQQQQLVLVLSLRGDVTQRGCVEPLMFTVEEREACGATRLCRCRPPPIQFVGTLFPRRDASTAGPLYLRWWCWCYHELQLRRDADGRLKARWAQLTHECLMSNTPSLGGVQVPSEGRRVLEAGGRCACFCTHCPGSEANDRSG